MPLDVPFVTVFVVPEELPTEFDIDVPVLLAVEVEVPVLLVQPSDPFVPVASD